jgi:hypothetical protein
VRVETPHRWLVFVCVTTASCCCIDYLSQVKAWMLIRAARAQGAWLQAYLIDIVFTALIAIGWTSFWLLVVLPILQRILHIEFLVINLIPYIASSLITAFVPTCTFALFIGVNMMSKAIRKLLSPFEILKSSLLDIEEKPFLATGCLVAFASIPVTSAFMIFWG